MTITLFEHIIHVKTTYIKYLIFIDVCYKLVWEVFVCGIFVIHIYIHYNTAHLLQSNWLLSTYSRIKWYFIQFTHCSSLVVVVVIVACTWWKKTELPSADMYLQPDKCKWDGSTLVGSHSTFYKLQWKD